jgi:hypothetical protein
VATISLEQRSKINHQLKQLGFGGINDPNLFSQMACLYRTHDSFRGLLMSTAPVERRIAYEALKPHLCFIAKPLDVYEREIHEKAEREQWDVIDPGNPHFPRPFKVGEVESPEFRLQKLAAEAIEQNAHEAQGGLELVCTKCTVAQVFWAKLRKDAEKQAQSAGWRWAEENGSVKTYCPQHVPGRGAIVLTCSACEKEEWLRAWDQQDGYAKARLAGWVIGEAAKCPKCAVKKIIVQ